MGGAPRLLVVRCVAIKLARRMELAVVSGTCEVRVCESVELFALPLESVMGSTRRKAIFTLF